MVDTEIGAQLYGDTDLPYCMCTIGSWVRQVGACSRGWLRPFSFTPKFRLRSVGGAPKSRPCQPPTPPYLLNTGATCQHRTTLTFARSRPYRLYRNLSVPAVIWVNAQPVARIPYPLSPGHWHCAAAGPETHTTGDRIVCVSIAAGLSDPIHAHKQSNRQNALVRLIAARVVCLLVPLCSCSDERRSTLYARKS